MSFSQFWIVSQIKYTVLWVLALVTQNQPVFPCFTFFTHHIREAKHIKLWWKKTKQLCWMLKSNHPGGKRDIAEHPGIIFPSKLGLKIVYYSFFFFTFPRSICLLLPYALCDHKCTTENTWHRSKTNSLLSPVFLSLALHIISSNAPHVHKHMYVVVDLIFVNSLEGHSD